MTDKKRNLAVAMGCVLLAALAIQWGLSHEPPLQAPSTERITVNNAIVLPEDTIFLIGPVVNRRGGMMADQFPHTIKLQETLKVLQKQVSEGATEITIVIDSPGGAWDRDSKQFILYLKKLADIGIQTTCIVDGIAASMGLVLHSACSNRYATANSYILWHSVSLSGQLRNYNIFDAYETVKYMEETNETLWSPVKKYFKKAYFDKHFKLESLLPVMEIERVGYSYLKVINLTEGKIRPDRVKAPVKKKEKVTVGPVHKKKVQPPITLSPPGPKSLPYMP